MKNFFSAMFTNAGIAGEILSFLWQRKLWWLIPMVATLLIIGLVLIFRLCIRCCAVHLHLVLNTAILELTLWTF